MNTSELYQALKNYVVEATTFNGVNVIFENQTGDMPPKPFVTIGIKAFKQLGTTLSKKLGSDGVEESVLPMKATVSFKCFGRKLFEAEELLEQIALKFNTELASEIFNGKLAKWKTLKEVTLIPSFNNNQVEHMAIFEIEIAYNKTVCHQVGFIEKVQFYNLIDKKEITIP